MPMATKLGRMINYLEGLLPVKSHNPFITWTFKIKSQTKDISPLSQCIWPPN